VYCNRLELGNYRGFGPDSVILFVARSTENASVDSCHVARMTILILESTDSDSSRRLACVCLVPKQCVSQFYIGFARFALPLHDSCFILVLSQLCSQL